MTTTISHFSGSYAPDDIQFLLSPLAMDMTPIDEKEELIQSGQKHYSEMLSEELPPSAAHRSFFTRAIAEQSVRLASEVQVLAARLAHHYPNAERPIVLVSLVRAGVPLGVMLHRELQRTGHASVHYGISIIRGRGIDETALAMIEARHGHEQIVFVDGWTGKGAISEQLFSAFANRPHYHGYVPPLVVLADPCGAASLSYSNDDWLIPFGVMGASVSGLISRSVWPSDKTGLHGCVECDHLRAWDMSQYLIDSVRNVGQDKINDYIAANPPKRNALTLTWPMRITHNQSAETVNRLLARYNVDDINRIKPSIVEATRAVMRRTPDHVLVADRSDPDVALLIELATERGVPVTEVDDLAPYRAVTIIKKVVV